MIKKLIGAASAAMWAGAALAVPVTVTYDPGTTLDTFGMSSDETLGSSMSGMIVDVFFSNGTTERVEWTTLGANSGGALATSWSLVLDGDSFFDPFVFTVGELLDGVAVTGLRLDGQPAKTVFDVWSAPEGSPGSSEGWAIGELWSGFPLHGSSQTGLEVVARYLNQVSVGGTVYGDLFTVLEISFLDPVLGLGGLGSGQNFSFVSDTDNTVGPIGRVPEPASLALLALGLVGLAGAARRRNG